MSRDDKVTIQSLKKMLIRAVNDHGHNYHCGASRGLESECTCGWARIKTFVKRISPPGGTGVT